MRVAPGGSLSHYRILEKIGEGGMGVVYLARDTHLERDVAIKILPAGTLADETARRRFRREALSLSRLNHPGIETIHDFDTRDGVDFLVVEYVEGVTLRERLREPIPLDERVALLEQCAAALAAAHARGIVHLDIKPENIMVAPGGRVKLLDFGIARWLHRVDPQAETETEPGPTARELGGTPGYMAPEVLLRRPVDGRADLFSLGVVAYEVLAGRRPFQGDTPAGTVALTLEGAQEPLERLRPEVPAGLAALVAKLLAREPADRYASAEDLVRDVRALRGAAPGGWRVARRLVRKMPLQGVLATAVLAAGAIVPLAVSPAARMAVARWAATLGLAPEKHLVVLPFRITGGPDDRALGAGLTDVLTARLAQMSGSHALQVVPSSAVRDLGEVDLGTVGRELGANFAVTGALLRSGEDLRVTLELVDLQRRRVVRAATVDVAFSGPFVLEDRVVEVAVDILAVTLPSREREALRGRGTADPRAQDLYLQGRGYLWNYDRLESVDRAIEAMRRAVELDPKYAQAQAGLGMGYWHRYEITHDGVWAERAASSCRQAARLDRGEAGAHTCLGVIERGTGRYREAVDAFEKAVALRPTDDEAVRGLAASYQRLGMPEEAERTFRRAIDLRPHYWAGYSWMGVFYFEQARYAEAGAMFRKVTSLAPRGYRGYDNLGATELIQGRYSRAIPLFQRSIALKPSAMAWSNLGAARFMLGNYEKAAAAYREAIGVGHEDYFIWGNLGEALQSLPDRDAEARSAYHRAIALATRELQINPKNADVLAELARYHAMLGEAEAAERLREAIAIGPPSPEREFTFAVTYARLGRTEETLDCLERAVGAGFPRAWVHDNPVFQELRGQPRFQDLMRRVP